MLAQQVKSQTSLIQVIIWMHIPIKTVVLLQALCEFVGIL